MNSCFLFPFLLGLALFCGLKEENDELRRKVPVLAADLLKPLRLFRFINFSLIPFKDSDWLIIADSSATFRLFLLAARERALSPLGSLMPNFFCSVCCSRIARMKCCRFSFRFLSSSARTGTSEPSYSLVSSLLCFF